MLVCMSVESEWVSCDLGHSCCGMDGKRLSLFKVSCCSGCISSVDVVW